MYMYIINNNNTITSLSYTKVVVNVGEPWSITGRPYPSFYYYDGPDYKDCGMDWMANGRH